MISRFVEYMITCDKCRQPLDYPDDSVMVAHRGHAIKEGTREHIKEVAEDMGWLFVDNKHLCPKCVE